MLGTCCILGQFLREAVDGWRPAAGRKPGLETCCQIGTIYQFSPLPFPRTISLRIPIVAIHGYPHPSGPCQCPKPVLSLRQQSALLKAKLPARHTGSHFGCHARLVDVSMGTYANRLPALLALSCCVYLVHTHLPSENRNSRATGAHFRHTGQPPRGWLGRPFAVGKDHAGRPSRLKREISWPRPGPT